MKSSLSCLVNPSDLPTIRQCGRILAKVRDQTAAAVQPGITFEELEAIAQRGLAENGAKPSFTTVEDYQWATCIVKNEGVCHGIPQYHIVEDGDLISIDVGALYRGQHTDTTVTVVAGKSNQLKDTVLRVGQEALTAAIAAAQIGNTVYDVSFAMQSVIEAAGFSAVYQLTGHGIGKKLHLPPNIPCIARPETKRIVLQERMALAIEPMFAVGDSTLVLDEDGWTYKTKDNSLSGMFEHTIYLTKNGPEVLTQSQ